jgi:N-acetylmuramoyl-L-alanine amidase
MKMARTLVAALVCSTVLAAPAVAAKPDNAANYIPNEGMWNAEKAPANYDAALKASKDKAAPGGDFSVMANPIIVLDPGHGGSDPGAVGNGLEEEDLTLDIANRCKSYMNANYPASVYMTRTSDTDVSLSSRATYANNLGADFFVSMHINSYTTSTPSGLEVYHYPGSTSGQNLATDVYDKLKASFSVLRGIKTAEFYVLKYTNMPAILGETGFISNPGDASKLATTTFRQQLAQQYAQGMHVYWWGY